jgi:hypothetical protein
VAVSGLVRVAWAGVQGGGSAGQAGLGQASELLAQLGWGGDQQGPQRVGGLGAGLEGALAGHAQHPQHLHGARAGLGRSGLIAGLDGAGGGVSVDGVGLALAPAGGPVGSVDLDHLDALGAQVAGQPSAVAAGPLWECQLEVAPL